MKKIIKKIAPQFIIKNLILLKNKFYSPWYKKQLVKKMELKHTEFLKNVRSKEKKRIVFLVTFESAWKLDVLFKRLLIDSKFEPLILVCPYTVYGEERMWEEMDKCFNFFSKKNYPVISSYNEQKSNWIELKELDADVVFFTNPHDLTRKEYYQDAYSNFLSCYVPYHYEVGQYDNNQQQYNLYFHNAIWKIFSPHQTSLKIFKNVCATKGKNVEVTGYPHVDQLYSELQKINSSVWKGDKEKIRIIWAPHHTIDSPELPYSNFLQYAEFFKEIAIKFQNQIQWCFKPHPILKSKLKVHKDWGEEKTNQYYDFWKYEKFSQLNEGEYVSLFNESDAMIHDSGSFLAEYLHVNKPVMYLINSQNYLDFYNDFGRKALACCDLGHSKVDIINFIEKIINLSELDVLEIKIRNAKLFEYETNQNASEIIFNILTKELEIEA